MEGMECWTRDESRLIGDPEVADRIKCIRKDYTLLEVNKDVLNYPV
jgi:hypothetical protein